MWCRASSFFWIPGFRWLLLHEGPACAGPSLLKRAVLFYGRYVTGPNGLNVAEPV
jgi:hypothetical protein